MNEGYSKLKLIGIAIILLFLGMAGLGKLLISCISNKESVFDSTTNIREASYIKADYTDVGNGIMYYSKTENFDNSNPQNHFF